MPEKSRNQYGQMICLFLAEGIRSRRISLKRSAEVAEFVLRHINLLETEKDFLFMAKELSKDFEELVVLENKMIQDKGKSEKHDLELFVKDYAVQIMTSDTQQAINILQDAASGNFTLEQLQTKYPNFNYEKLKR